MGNERGNIRHLITNFRVFKISEVNSIQPHASCPSLNPKNQGSNNYPPKPQLLRTAFGLAQNRLNTIRFNIGHLRCSGRFAVGGGYPFEYEPVVCHVINLSESEFTKLEN